MATRLKIRLCTWNLGNAAPPSDLSPWLGSPSDTFDVIVIGAQECHYGSHQASPARSDSTDSSTSAGSPPPSPSQLNGETLAGKGSSRTGLISRAIKSVCRFRPRPLPLEEASPSRSAGSSTIETNSPVVSGMEDCSPATYVVESDPPLVSTKETCPPASPNPNTLYMRKPGHLDGLRRRQTDSTANYKPISPVSPGPLSRFTSFRDRHLPQMLVRTGRTECHALDDQTDLVDELMLVKARDDNERAVPPPLPSYLRTIDDPLAIDDLPSNISVRLDALTGFPAKDVGQVVTPKVQDAEENTCCDENDRASVGGDGGVSSDDSASNSGTGTSSPTTSVAVDAPWLPGLNAVYMLGSPTQRKFERAVAEAIPDTYELVAKRHMYEMTLLIYVHKRARDSVGKTEVMAEATGLGNVVGNKGAVVAKISFDGTSFCFVSSHLAAHEGSRYRKQRHEHVAEIMRSIENHGPKKIPFLHQFDHIFWMGDLNYRLDMAKMLPATESWPHERRFRYVTNLITEGRIRDVASLDELRHAMVQREVFPGFAEGALSFPPTFKVKRGGDDVGVDYQPARIPAYCDRILWHSKTIHASHVKQREYNSVPSFHTSDHKPVYAVFEVVVPRKTASLPSAAPPQPLKCSINFHCLKVKWPMSPMTSGNEERGVTGIRNGRGWAERGEADVPSGAENTDAVLQCTDMPPTPRKLEKVSNLRDTAAVVQGNGLFAGGQTYKALLSTHHGPYACEPERLPCIPLDPIADLNALMYKYVTISFRRGRRRYRQACEFPMVSLVNEPEHRIRQTLDLTERGVVVGSVEVDVQLCVSNAA